MTEYSDRWQYLRSEDKRVVELARQYEHNAREWVRKCRDFNDRHHVRVAFDISLNGGRKVVGVDADPGLGDLPGEWGMPDEEDVRWPCEGNTEAKELLGSLVLHDLIMPGVPKVVSVGLPFGYASLCGTLGFSWKGAVWARAGAGVPPDPAVWQHIGKAQYEEALEGMDKVERERAARAGRADD